jgi:orotidine-5'-phosphate decarboxylase
MGIDSVEPFLEFSNKYTIVLGLTSNKGSQNFQTNPIYEPHLYKTVLKTIKSWGSVDNLMFVVGATKADSLKEIRKIIPNHFLLIPGVGAQGGNATEVCVNGKNSNGGLLINSSRGIIYASSDKNFAKDARQKAKELALETKPYTQHL